MPVLVEGRCRNPECPTLINAVEEGIHNGDLSLLHSALKVARARQAVKEAHSDHARATAQEGLDALLDGLVGEVSTYDDERERVTASYLAATRAQPSEWATEPCCDACGGDDTTDMDEVEC